MTTTFDVLVIVLGCLLGLFLILSIVAAALTIKVVSSIKRIVDKGEQVVDSAEAAAEMFKRAAGPFGALRSLLHVVETVKRKRGKE